WMAAAAVCDRHKSVPSPWDFDLLVRVLKADEEELVPKSKRQVFEKWRIYVRAQPTQGTLRLMLQMPSSTCPAPYELIGCSIHWYRDVVHRACSRRLRG